MISLRRGSRNGHISVLAALPAPYYIEAFNRLNQLTGGKLVVRFLALTNPRRHWRVPVERMHFEWSVFGGGADRNLLNQFRAGWAMLRFLLRRRPQAVISGGYDSLAAWVALIWCKVFKRRLVLWLDSQSCDARPDSRLRTTLKKFFVSHCSSVAVLGKAAQSYAIDLGVRQGSIFKVPFGGDTSFFVREAQKVDVVAEKERRGWPARLILYSGRLSPEKGLLVLLRAFKTACEVLPDIGLLMVGGGPLRADLEGFCKENSLERVFFIGPQPYEEMPRFYAFGDVLVLPSLSEPYGFVVIEAFACGVPAIVSRVAGAAADLIVEGKTGYCVAPGDAADLAAKMVSVLEDREVYEQMRENCRRVADEFGPVQCASGLLAAVEHTGTGKELAVDRVVRSRR